MFFYFIKVDHNEPYMYTGIDSQVKTIKKWLTYEVFYILILKHIWIIFNGKTGK